MTFTAGTYSNNTSTMANTALADLKTKIDAHPAWQWVEQWVSAGETWEVFRCLGAVSGYPQDYYVYFRSNGSQALFYMLSEGWNATTKKMIRPVLAITNSTTGIVPEADGGVVPVAMEWAHEVGQTPLGWNQNTLPQKLSTSVIGTVLDYAILVSSTTLIICYRGQLPIYIGGFNTKVKMASTDPLPLLFGPSLSGNSYGNSWQLYTTRHPQRGGLSTIAAGMLEPYYNANVGWPSTFSIGIKSDMFQGGGVWASPLLVLMFTAGTTTEANGYLRGEYKHLIQLNASAAVVSWLDSVQVGNSTYVNVSGSIWIDQGA